jgi:hypothetical protein
MSDERDIRVEDKLDKVMEHISSIDSTLAVQAASLNDHIRRTELLEAAVVPMKKSYDVGASIGKILVFAATIGAGIEGFILLTQWLKK